MSFIKKLVQSRSRRAANYPRRSLPVGVPVLLDVLPCLTRDDLVRCQRCSRGLRKFIDENANLMAVHCTVELRLKPYQKLKSTSKLRLMQAQFVLLDGRGCTVDFEGSFSTVARRLMRYVRNTVVKVLYLDVFLNPKMVTEWKIELERHGLNRLNCAVHELDAPSTVESLRSLINLWDMLKPHYACRVPTTLSLRLEQVVSSTLAHHYADPSALLKTLLRDACLKGHLVADRLNIRFCAASLTIADEIVKFFTSLSDTRCFPDEVLVSFVETPEVTRYDYARQQRLMWPDCENHPFTVSNAHQNVTVFQPFRNPSTGHKLRVVMQNRYSPSNRNLPDFPYPQATSTTSNLILVSDSPLYYNEEHKNREIRVRAPQPKRQWSEEHVRRNLHQRAMAAGRYEYDVTRDWPRMNCSPSPKAALLAPALAVIGLTEMACQSQSDGCIFRRGF